MFPFIRKNKFTEIRKMNSSRNSLRNEKFRRKTHKQKEQHCSEWMLCASKGLCDVRKTLLLSQLLCNSWPELSSTQQWECQQHVKPIHCCLFMHESALQSSLWHSLTCRCRKHHTDVQKHPIWSSWWNNSPL